MAAIPVHVYRNYARQLHVTAGHFLSMTCWTLSLDTIIVNRHSLLKYFALEEFGPERFNWFANDVKDYFPFVAKLSVKPASKKTDGILFSRSAPQPYTLKYATSILNNKNYLNRVTAKMMVMSVPNQSVMFSMLSLSAQGSVTFAEAYALLNKKSGSHIVTTSVD